MTCTLCKLSKQKLGALGSSGRGLDGDGRSHSVLWPVLVWILESGNGVAFRSLYSLDKKAVVRFLFKLASFCLTPEVCS